MKAVSYPNQEQYTVLDSRAASNGYFSVAKGGSKGEQTGKADQMDTLNAALGYEGAFKPEIYLQLLPVKLALQLFELSLFSRK